MAQTFPKMMMVIPAVLVVLATSSCKTTNPYTGEQEMTNTAQKAMIGAAGGAILGAVIGNNT